MEKGLVPALIISAVVHGALLHLLGSEGHRPGSLHGPLNLSVALIAPPVTGAPSRPAEIRAPAQPGSQPPASQSLALPPDVTTPIPANQPHAPLPAPLPSSASPPVARVMAGQATETEAAPAAPVAPVRQASARPEPPAGPRQQGWFDLSPADFMRETYLTSLRKQLALHLQGRLPVQRSRDGGPAVRVDLTLLPGGRLAGIRVTTGTLLSGPVERALADGLTLPPPPQALSESFLDPFFLVSIEQGEVIVR